MTYFLLYIFIISYWIGFKIIKKNKSPNTSAIIPILADQYIRLNQSKTITTILIVSLLVLFFYLFSYYEFITNSNISEARTSRFNVGEGGIFKSQIEFFIFNYFLMPIVWFAKFFTSFGVVFEKTRTKIWILSFAIFLLYFLFGAGRTIIMEIVIMIFFLSLLHKSRKTSKKKKLKTLAILSIVFAASYIIALYGTLFRITNIGDSLLENIPEAQDRLLSQTIIYFIGSFRAFQYALDNYTDILGINYGFYTFSGIDELYSIIPNILGGQYIPANHQYGALLKNEIYIGYDQTFNALYTALFNFYFDFSYFGIVFFGLIFGMISSYSLKLLYKKSHIFYLFISCLFFSASILSSQSWRFQTGSSLVVILISLLLIKIWKKLTKNQGSICVSGFQH